MTSSNDRFSVQLPREADYQASEAFQFQVEALVKEQPDVLSIDCRYVDHLTSFHVRLLWSARTVCANACVALRLTSASEFVWKVLNVLDISEFFIIDEEPHSSQSSADATELLASMDVYEDSFPADEGSINAALQRFLAHLTSLSIPVGTQYVLRTLFYEVATNIRLHGSTEQPQQIEFSAIPDSVKIVLTFVDQGPPFDPTDCEVTPIAGRSGEVDRISFGISILRQLTDRLDYKRVDGLKNVLVLERKWRMPKWTKPPSHSVP